MTRPADADAGQAPPPDPFFPLVRHLSRRLTPLLARAPCTPNQITAASLVAGLAGAYCFAIAGRAWAVLGGALLVICYVLDNCDGEIARLKDLASPFGERFDTFVDWVVHAALFLALGLGMGEARGDRLWLWLGVAAACGGTLNYAIGLVYEAGGSAAERPAPVGLASPSRPWDRVVFAFRELSRADFCFVVLALSLLDLVWVLLPLAAVGAQAYWLLGAVRSARRYHV